MSIHPDHRLKRNQTIQQRISEGLLTDPKVSRLYMKHASVHAEVEMLREVLQRTDEAMQLEQIPQDVRDRIVHTVIYGEPAKDPRAEQEHEQRMQKYGLELQENLKKLPPLIDINLEEL